MFGSPSASTPFGKSRGLVSTTPAMSFGQQSATKRKREQMTPALTEKANTHVKALRQAPPNSNREETVSSWNGRLFPRGQYIHHQAPGHAVVFHQHFISNPAVHIILNKMDIINLFGTIDCGVGPSESFDIVSCTSNGRIMIANVTADGVQTTFECNVHLQEEAERITQCCHAGNVVVLGTSSEELYLIRRYGRALTADRLQRNRGLFANFLNSGARFMGIVPAHSSSSRIVKVLPVPLSCLLVGVGSSMLTVWTDWTNPGSEQVVWQHNLKEVIAGDVASLDAGRGNQKLEIVDACLMPVELGSDRATMLVLSASYLDDSSAFVSAALWLHTLEIQIPASSSGLVGSVPLNVLHRLLLSDSARFKPFNSDTMTDGASEEDDKIAPRIFALHPSWRVFSAWSAASQALGAAGSAAYTVHAAQIDVLNQSLLNATASFERAGRGSGSTYDTLKCKHAVDSEIRTSAVGAISTVVGTDGVCIVQTDGSVSVLTPPLPKRTPASFPLQTTTVRDRQGPSDKAGQTEELASVLHSAALDEIALDGATQAARDGFASSSPADALAAVQSASSRLLSRSSTGRYWAGAEGTRSGQGALTRYQMVHRLVESKLNAHKQLLNLVASTDAYDLDTVKLALLRDHQLLLLSAGLSGALEEAQLRLSSAEGVSGAESLDPGVHSAHRAGAVAGAAEALSVVAQGMERAVRVGRGRSLEEIDSQGLSVADIFYSEAALVLEGVESIVYVLLDAQPALAQRGVLLETVSGVASIVLSAVQFATVGDGAESAASFVGCNQKLRASLTTLVRLLKDATSALPTDASTGRSPVGDREGKRLRELCQSLLQGFLKELTAASSSVEDMNRDWRAQYHHAKGICSALLIATGQYQACFALCSEHLYCLGVMESAEKEPHLLRARLEELLRKQGAVVGTDSVALATGCFLWLEAHSRPAEILSLGLACPSLLEEFLKTRTHLSWMHHLRSGSFAAATVAAVDCASSVPVVSKATTLLSIAKLSAKLAQGGDSAPHAAQPKRLFGGASAPSSSSSSSASAMPTPAVLEAATNNMHADLAVLRAQELISDTFPNLDFDREARLPVSDIIRTITRALQYQGSAAERDPSHALAAEATSDLVRCFGVALSLLSMQMDMLDALLRETETEAETEAEAEETGANGQRNELQKQQRAFSAMLTELWAALIAANTSVWLELCCYSDLGVQEEMVLRNECWLYAAVASAIDEAAASNLREELIPIDTGDSSNTLLQKALSASGLCTKRLGSDGDIEELPSGQSNQRLIHIIKVCVGIALGGETRQQ